MVLFNKKTKDKKPEWMEQRFKLNENTIIDNKSGLEWKRDFNDKIHLPWLQAMQQVQGKDGWHLPSRIEWKTLAQSKEYPLIKELEQIGFRNITKWCWTSEEQNETHAWDIWLLKGVESEHTKESGSWIISVRKFK